MQVKVSAQYKNEIDMAKAQRDYELKKAAYDIEVNTKKAESEMAYQLQVHTLKKKKSQVHVTVQLLQLGFLCFMYPFCLNRFKAWLSVFSCIFNIV